MRFLAIWANLAKEFPIPKTFGARFPNRAREMAYFGASCFVVGVKSERVWEHLNGGWIPVFFARPIATPRDKHGGRHNLCTPPFHVRDFCQGRVRVCVYASRGKTGRCCALHLSKCRSVSDATSVWKRWHVSGISKNFTKKNWSWGTIPKLLVNKNQWFCNFL